MCNLYKPVPQHVLEGYVRAAGLQLDLILDGPGLRHGFVGPFDRGLFFVSDGRGSLLGREGQWGMIRPGQLERIEYKERPPLKPGGKPRLEPMLKNNARIETAAKSPAFRDAWRQGRRCLIPAEWLQEPNWESGKCAWWHLRRADGLPWMIAGLYSEWVDPETGEVVLNYAMLTFNVNHHPLLNRLHRPDKDKVTGEVLPPELQDKRGEAHIEPEHWSTWLTGDEASAAALLQAPDISFYGQMAPDAVSASANRASANASASPRAEKPPKHKLESRTAAAEAQLDLFGERE